MLLSVGSTRDSSLGPAAECWLDFYPGDQGRGIKGNKGANGCRAHCCHRCPRAVEDSSCVLSAAVAASYLFLFLISRSNVQGVKAA